MLTIRKTAEGEKLTFCLSGRLDAHGAQQLQEELKRALANTTELIFDMEQLSYISSDGLRVLLMAQKQMNLQGRMRLCSVNETVMDTLELSGFVDIFYISE